MFLSQVECSEPTPVQQQELGLLRLPLTRQNHGFRDTPFERLGWRTGHSHASHMELAWNLFWKRQYVIVYTLEACDGDGITFRDLAFRLRRMCVYIDKMEHHGVFPGRTCLQKHGVPRADFSSGHHSRCSSFVFEELRDLALLMDGGCWKNISSWDARYLFCTLSSLSLIQP